MIAPITARAMNSFGWSGSVGSSGTFRAPRKIWNLPKNPPVGGMPIRLNRNSVIKSALPGCVRPNPATSSSVSTDRSGVLSAPSTANAPTVIAP